MIIDYTSIAISFILIFLFVFTPRTPSFLLLLFIIIYYVICWWHIYNLPIKDVYMTSFPIYLSNKKDKIINESILSFDLFFTVFLFVIVILLSRLY